MKRTKKRTFHGVNYIHSNITRLVNQILTNLLHTQINCIHSNTTQFFKELNNKNLLHFATQLLLVASKSYSFLHHLITIFQFGSFSPMQQHLDQNFHTVRTGATFNCTKLKLACDEASIARTEKNLIGFYTKNKSKVIMQQQQRHLCLSSFMSLIY